ncbi:MAG: GTPase/DUF3482 domain-containing protein [Desulfococcus multivorans]|jgi:hypothetical protein|nr:GTPase/DUF3482 domain-containing protein [Desulfococcus multivorans]
MNTSGIPTFAILGHPNEGKSSVVSTLAEDDSVPISPIPGETKACREYPVAVDGRDIIRFVDTPGFQQPRQTLAWMNAHEGPDQRMLSDFLAARSGNPDFADECELFAPLSQGAGIIFVVDGSRPVRRMDKIEMEILRRTGLPRMAVINAKEKNRPEFREDWKAEARKHFNTIRIFDAQRATYAERIDLLESLKIIDPDWRPPLEAVIAAFQEDWHRRIQDSASILLDLLTAAARLQVSKTCGDEAEVDAVRKVLQAKFREDLARLETAAQKEIRRRFKHNIFHYALPPQSIVHEDLFSKNSWRVLGMKKWQLAAAGAAGGGALGAKIDLALAGQGMGISTAVGGLVGGIIGGGSAVFGVRRAAAAKVKGLPLGRLKVRVGPVKNDQLLYVLLDRMLIYFSHVINWAHSRRDRPEPQSPASGAGKKGLTAGWDGSVKKSFARFFQAAKKQDGILMAQVKPRVTEVLVKTLTDLSALK